MPDQQRINSVAALAIVRCHSPRAVGEQGAQVHRCLCSCFPFLLSDFPFLLLFPWWSLIAARARQPPRSPRHAHMHAKYFFWMPTIICGFLQNLPLASSVLLRLRSLFNWIINFFLYLHHLSNWLDLTAMFSYSQIPEECTMQKEDSTSHQTCGTCMEY